jgi:hypothetical protein
MIEAFELIRKHGVNALCFMALWWMNSRLESVENKLYSCWEAKAIYQRNLSKEDKINNRVKLIAVVPHDIYTKKHIQRYVKA